MSVIATPAAQITLVDESSSPQSGGLQGGGIPLTCAAGSVAEDVLLAANSSSVALPFPSGVTTAVYIFIAAITATDLHVNVNTGSGIAVLPLPAKTAMLLYNLTSSQITLSSVLGGQIQVSVGG